MSAPIVYLLAHNSSTFPAGSLEGEFQLVRIPEHSDEPDWFNWDVSGCLIFESEDLAIASRLMNQLRMHWITVPFIAYSPVKVQRGLNTEQLDFDYIIDTHSVDDRRWLIRIRELLEWDQSGIPSPMKLRQRIGTLSEQERRVLQLGILGFSSREIGRELEIRSQTVDKYRRKTLAKMRSKNFVSLTRELFQTLLHPGGRTQFQLADRTTRFVTEQDV